MATISEAFFWSRNLREAIKFLEELPDKSVNLSVFNEDAPGEEGVLEPTIEHACKSVACIGGWVAVMPYFKQFGVQREEGCGSPEIRTKRLSGDDARVRLDCDDVAILLFGEPEMFDVRRPEESEGKLKEKTDREIAIRRLKVQLKVLKKQAPLYTTKVRKEDARV